MDGIPCSEYRVLQTCFLWLINWLKHRATIKTIKSRIRFRNTSKRSNFDKEIFIVIKPGPKKDPDRQWQWLALADHCQLMLDPPLDLVLHFPIPSHLIRVSQLLLLLFLWLNLPTLAFFRHPHLLCIALLSSKLAFLFFLLPFPLRL